MISICVVLKKRNNRKYSVVNKKINKNEKQRNKYHTIRCYPYVDVWYLKKNILCMENKLKRIVQNVIKMQKQISVIENRDLTQ